MIGRDSGAGSGVTICRNAVFTARDGARCEIECRDMDEFLLYTSPKEEVLPMLTAPGGRGSTECPTTLS